MSKEQAKLTLLSKNFQLRPLPEMALRIGRISRWAGATGTAWYSVLHHSFVVENIVCDILENAPIRYRDAVRLYALIHDLHESYSSDIPTPLKTAPVRETLRHVDTLIYNALGIAPPDERIVKVVKAADERAWMAEAVALDDPGPFIDPNYMDIARAKVQQRDKHHVRTLLKMYGSPTLTTSKYSLGVQDYILAVQVGALNINRLTSEDDWTGPTEMLADLGPDLDVAPFIPNPYVAAEAA